MMAKITVIVPVYNGEKYLHECIDSILGQTFKDFELLLLDDGNLNDKNIAYSNDELHHLMADSKIMVCFPRCDTNPETAVEIETLTQRYWEAMLSRCVIIGRAPKELINIIGYNPVIDVDWNNAEEQITHILATISDYQELVDKNYKTAIEYADWNKRMKQILNVVNIK